MASFLARTRFASLVAIGLALLLSGVVAGAAGGNFILGQANSAGTSNTSLTTSSTGNALLVTQNGTGTAIRGSTGSGAGIAGFFTSGSGSGVSGVVANQNKYGIYAANDSPAEGSGAAMRVNGKQNEGVIATSDETDALRGVVTGCDGALCGGSGLYGKGFGNGTGVTGDGLDSLAGILGVNGTTAAVWANQSEQETPAVLAEAFVGTGVRALGEGATSSVGDCTPYFCAGVAASGDIGVIAATQTASGYALFGLDRTGADLAWGLVTLGDANIGGDLVVSGTCIGCTLAATAVNGSKATLHQGDAVALDGLRTAPDGSTVLVVRAARKGDQVIGIVDRALSLSGEIVKIPASEHRAWDPNKGEHMVTTPAREIKAQSRKWLAGVTAVSADAYLRIVTAGMFTMETGVASVEAGDTLAVGDTTGKLGKAGHDAARGTVAGRFLGKLDDGRTVLLVDPS